MGKQGLKENEKGGCAKRQGVLNFGNYCIFEFFPDEGDTSEEVIPCSSMLHDMSQYRGKCRNNMCPMEPIPQQCCLPPWNNLPGCYPLGGQYFVDNYYLMLIIISLNFVAKITWKYVFDKNV